MQSEGCYWALFKDSRIQVSDPYSDIMKAQNSSFADGM